MFTAISLIIDYNSCRKIDILCKYSNKLACAGRNGTCYNYSLIERQELFHTTRGMNCNLKHLRFYSHDDRIGIHFNYSKFQNIEV